MDFFDLLKEKMAALRPSLKHRDKDWAALTAQLDQALPQQAPGRSRAWVPLLLLLLALLWSNAFWWHGNRETQAAMHRIETQLASLQTMVSALKTTAPIIQRDTIWRTLYIQAPARERFATTEQWTSAATISSAEPLEKQASGLAESKLKAGEHKLSGVVSDNQPERTDLNQTNLVLPPGQQIKSLNSSRETSLLSPIQLPQFSVLKSTTRRTPAAPDVTITDLPEPHRSGRPLGPLLLHTLTTPKYFKLSPFAGWTHPLSAALKHQVGFELGAQAAIGFSRHWALMLEYSYAQLHYEANKPTAVLGRPELPALPTPEHHYGRLDVQKQTFQQFGLGLRYTCSDWGKTRPYIGLNWGNQMVQAFGLEYEVRHEQSSIIQQGTLQIDQTIRLRNYLRLSGGLGIPLSERLDLSVEGFYQRQLAKKNNRAFDLMGLRLGASWMF